MKICLSSLLLIFILCLGAGGQTDRQVADKLNISPEQVERLNDYLGLTNQALSKLPQDLLPRLIRRVEHPDIPWRRIAFRSSQEKDENGQVAPDALPKAIEQLNILKSRTTKFNVAGMQVRNLTRLSPSFILLPPPVAGLERGAWVSLGPGNVGGRIRSIVISPVNPDLIWIGSIGGGIWQSVDGGVNFSPVDNTMANLAVSSMVIDPANPQIMYAGTGEGFFFNIEDGLRGAGIFQSTDGVGWRRIPATNNPNFYYVNRLAISPNGGVLIAATRKGIFRSGDAPRANWTQTLSGEAISDVRFHPGDPLKLIAGALDSGEAYYSDNGGLTWRPATHNERWGGRVELTYSAANPAVVYASVDINGGEIWRSADGGKSYSRMNSVFLDGKPANYLGRQGWYDNVIWAGDPTNQDMVIVGGINLWRSMDGGNTLTDISTWFDPRSVHADHHSIVAHPGFNGSNNRTVFFANDGGIFKTSDISGAGSEIEPPKVRGWLRLGNGLTITQFYGGAGHPPTGRIVGGAQDNGTLLFEPSRGTNGWVETVGGDGGFNAWDLGDPRFLYGEYVDLNIHRNTDGGTTPDTRGDRYISGLYYNFKTRTWDWKPFPYHIPDARNKNTLFISPFVLDPNNSNRILAGGASLWRSNDVKTPNTERCDRPAPCGPRWMSIKDGSEAKISAIAIAKGASDLIWIGDNTGGIYKTLNGTSDLPVWQRIDKDESILPNRYCTRIVIDSSDNQVVYLTFSGYSPGNVWKSADGGVTWANLGRNLPEAPVRSLAIHPRNPKFLYVGTEVGVFASEDGGLTWSPSNEGPVNCSVDELFWMGEDLIAMTHGRGVFKIKL